MKNNNHFIKFEAAGTSDIQLAYYNASLFELNIEGSLSHKSKKTDWTVTARYVTDEERFMNTSQYPEEKAVILYFDIRPRIGPGINLAVKTCIKDEFLLAYEELIDDNWALPLEMEVCPPPDDFLDILSIDPPSEADEDFSPDTMPEEFDIENHPPVSSNILNNKTACVGEGFVKTDQNSNLPYFGAMVGIRVLYDQGKDEIIQVSTDDGCANWYESAYQVIIYPTGIPSCPIVTVAICFWVADLSKSLDLSVTTESNLSVF
jgi:hypothetical protein